MGVKLFADLIDALGRMANGAKMGNKWVGVELCVSVKRCIERQTNSRFSLISFMCTPQGASDVKTVVRLAKAGGRDGLIEEREQLIEQEFELYPTV